MIALSSFVMETLESPRVRGENCPILLHGADSKTASIGSVMLDAGQKKFPCKQMDSHNPSSSGFKL
jgi:hypothetical protein